MHRKKFGAMLLALLTGAVLSTGRASAQSGYLMGDPAPAKLIPFYRTGPNLATLIGVTNTEGNRFGPTVDLSGDPDGDLLVHVTVFSRRSAEVFNIDFCLSPSDFGWIVLQNDPASAQQKAELAKRGTKAAVISVNGDGIPVEGYVTLATRAEFASHNGKCSGDVEFPDFPPTIGDLTSHNEFTEEHLATWAILADVGQGFFASEIPTPTALVDPNTGVVHGGPGAYGLIPGPPLSPGGCANPFDTDACVTSNTSSSHGSTVIARFDVNPVIDSHTEVFVWLKRNANNVAGDPGSGVLRDGGVIAFLDCEDELRVSTALPLPDEVNIINPDTLSGIGQCKALGQYRGNLLFDMPDTGFLWSQITQESIHFRENYIGYNLGDNYFIDCADGVNDFFNDPDNSAPSLCGGVEALAGTR